MTQEELEKQVMAKMLDENHSIMDRLKQQHLSASVLSREFTGYGFFTTYDVPDTLKIDGISGEISDVVATFTQNDNIMGFRLTLDGGKLDTLEGYAAFGDWPDSYDSAIFSFFNENKRSIRIKGFEL